MSLYYGHIFIVMLIVVILSVVSLLKGLVTEKHSSLHTQHYDQVLLC
jgi:hypothetical protein